MLREGQNAPDSPQVQSGNVIHDISDDLSDVDNGATPSAVAVQVRPASGRPLSSDHYTGDPESSIWSQVGVGENGSIVYNGPTSRFHAGPVAENDEVGEVSEGTAEGNGEKASHIEYLNGQYDLLDSVWQPLVKSKSMAAFGITAEIGSDLLDMYWTWLHPLHNCIYRPGKLIHCVTTISLHRLNISQSLSWIWL